MGVRILYDKDDNYCCFYCSSTMVVFGSIMYSYEEAEEFLKWLSLDARRYPDWQLNDLYYKFKKERGL